VLGIDGEKLSFSIKQLHKDPWLDRVGEFTAGQKVSGKILRWNAQGVFIELKEDVQGFFSLNQFGVSNHSELKLRDGDVMEGVILEINANSHRIELKKEEVAEKAAPAKKEAPAEDEEK